MLPSRIPMTYFSMNAHTSKEDMRRTDHSLTIWIIEAKAIPPKRKYFCEVELDGKVSSRTTSKLRGEMLFWVEAFHFKPIPTIEQVKITVFKESEKKKKKEKHSPVGFVTIPVQSISGCPQAGKILEQWYPLQLPGSTSSTSAANSSGHPAPNGSIRVKAHFLAVDILPLGDYMGLLSYVQEHYLDLYQAVHTLPIKEKEVFSQSLVQILHTQGKIEEFFADVIQFELSRQDNPRLVFRGNNLATKAMESYLKLIGAKYLEQTLSGFVRDVYETDKETEVDPAKIPLASNIKDNRDTLATLCQISWGRIVNSLKYFPSELKSVFWTLKETLASYQHDIIDNIITGSIFLRFICPAIMSPNLFNLQQAYPSEKTSRTLTLVAKTMQALANFSEFGDKEEYMVFLNPFMSKEIPNMRSFLKEISTQPQKGVTPTEPDHAVDLGRELSILHSMLTQLPPEKVQPIGELGVILNEITQRYIGPPSSATSSGGQPANHLPNNPVNIQTPFSAANRMPSQQQAMCQQIQLHHHYQLQTGAALPTLLHHQPPPPQPPAALCMPTIPPPPSGISTLPRSHRVSSSRSSQPSSQNSMNRAPPNLTFLPPPPVHLPTYENIGHSQHTNTNVQQQQSMEDPGSDPRPARSTASRSSSTSGGPPSDQVAVILEHAQHVRSHYPPPSSGTGGGGLDKAADESHLSSSKLKSRLGVSSLSPYTGHQRSDSQHLISPTGPVPPPDVVRPQALELRGHTPQNLPYPDKPMEARHSHHHQHKHHHHCKPRSSSTSGMLPGEPTDSSSSSSQTPPISSTLYPNDPNCLPPPGSHHLPLSGSRDSAFVPVGSQNGAGGAVRSPITPTDRPLSFNNPSFHSITQTHSEAAKRPSTHHSPRYQNHLELAHSNSHQSNFNALQAGYSTASEAFKPPTPSRLTSAHSSQQRTLPGSNSSIHRPSSNRDSQLWGDDTLGGITMMTLFNPIYGAFPTMPYVNSTQDEAGNSSPEKEEPGGRQREETEDALSDLSDGANPLPSPSSSRDTRAHSSSFHSSLQGRLEARGHKHSGDVHHHTYREICVPVTCPSKEENHISNQSSSTHKFDWFTEAANTTQLLDDVFAAPTPRVSTSAVSSRKLTGENQQSETSAVLSSSPAVQSEETPTEALLKKQLQELKDRLDITEQRLNESEDVRLRQASEKDFQIKEAINRLVTIEEEMGAALKAREQLISLQEDRIDTLITANSRLFSALNVVKERNCLPLSPVTCASSTSASFDQQPPPAQTTAVASATGSTSLNQQRSTVGLDTAL